MEGDKHMEEVDQMNDLWLSDHGMKIIEADYEEIE